MVQDHFDHLADSYDEVFKSHIWGHYLRKRVRYFKDLNPGHKLLDFGCGTGLLASELVKGGFSVSGTDYSAKMLEKARERGVDGRVTKSGEIPFDSNQFDLVYSVAVFHHLETVENVNKAIKEMARVTKPGGKILIWDHNPSNFYWKILMPRLPQDHGDERLVPAREIISAYNHEGVKLDHWDCSGWVPEFIPNWFMPVMRGVEWTLERTPVIKNLSAHNVVVGIKS